MKRVRRFWSASLSLLVFIGSTHAQSDLEIQLLRYKHFLSTFAVSLDTSLTLLRGGAWDEGRNVHNGDLIPLPSIQPSNNANDVQLQVVVTDNRLFRSSRKFDYSYCPDNNFTSSVAFQEEESSSSSSKGTTTITSSTLGQIGRHKLCITTSSMLGLRKDTLIVNWWIVPGDDETPGSAPVAAVPVPAPSPPTAPSASSAELDGAARPDGTAAVLVVGELRQWHKISLVFFGPMTSEDATPNPFTDYRLDVVFSQVVGGATNELLKQQQKLTVPGYYAADGDAANTGANKGSQWHCHFAPPSTGTWTWKAFFVTGPNVATEDRPVNATTAIATKGKPTAFDGTNGTLTIQPTDKTGRDLRAKGLLRQVPGKHHWQFAGTGEWFLKVGTDSPENFLAYDDFDNTPNYRGYRKSWSNHIRDFVEGDPTWDGSHGKGIIGAINYLSSQRMRAFSFLVNNIGGDDQNVFPFVSKTERTRFDVSKTAQWEIVFEHANRKGLFLHFKTQEEESDQFLDDGALGNQRKLFYRELIARFGHHLALNWNLGEESTNTDEQRKEFADWIKALDPYKHPIVVHTFPDEQYAVYAPLYGYKTIDGASIQTSASSVFEDTLFAVTASSVANRSWVVTNDEQGSSGMGVKPDRVDSTHFDIRHQVLWGNIMVRPLLLS